MRLSPEVHLSHGAASCMMEQLAAGMKRWFELVSMKMMLKRFCRYLCAILLVRISQLGYTLKAAEDHEATVFAITVWHIWESRNAVRNVIRDHDGDFKMAFCKVMDRIKDPEMAEAMAVRCAVIFAKEKNLQHIVVASDCHNIIKKLQSQNLDRSEVGAIICDIKNLVREVTFSFMYIRRSCNEAAHVMARLAD
ncbi:uncharacterized protein LOC120690499 isoform X1 [Panicum virgatum]|uniref:uncharacterized protein LOC120690499 isoform X1 n=1 Tax=Panicum virgatum TaxID=38727 RepID=UPI0019D58207|nr:uncharacterized protein LOC120690499 isoform X1 [Panicum virgatum]